MMMKSVLELIEGERCFAQFFFHRRVTLVLIQFFVTILFRGISGVLDLRERVRGVADHINETALEHGANPVRDS